jgi:hypothetical protein
MADSKISALPASTTPLAGTEVLPIVQSSTTKQVSVANLTAGRAISATELTLTTGNLIVANGQGIDFSATSSGSGTMTSELLSDYEEGTFTPATTTITTVTGTPVYTGQYTKVGRQVFISIDMTGGDISVVAGNSFFNLPFTAARSCWGATGNSGYASTGGFCLIGTGSATLYLATTASYTGFFSANVVYTI